MTRHRSKSLVQSIASDLPEFHEETPSGPASPAVVTEPTKNFLVKSKSELTLHQNFGADKSLDPDHLLHPLRSHELEGIWNKYIESNFDLGLVPSFEDQMSLSALSQLNVINFQKTIEVNTHQLNSFIDQNNKLIGQLNEIVEKNLHINHQTEDFNTKSLSLINTTTDLSEKISSITLVLKNFEKLDEITRKLSMPNSSKLIKYSKFNEILDNLNMSLDFLKENPKFKENEKFRIKFRQCLTRCLTLIKDFLIGNLKNLNDTIRAKTANSSADLVDVLIYSEFEDFLQQTRGEFHHFANLVWEIRKRVELSGEVEYNGFLTEILNNYCSIRLGFLKPYIVNNLNNNNSSNLVQFTQDNISFLQKVLLKEFDLFKKVFFIEDAPKMSPMITEVLYSFLKDAIDPFYDSIRHKILKEANISALVQVTNLLQKYYEFEHDENEINFGEIFESISNDVQSRLIFRIQIYVDNKLIPYKPKPEDLKIGNKKVSNDNELNENFPDNLFEDLYLPLGKALTILSNIYELVNSMVFDDLAHYIVHSCIEILKNNAYKLCVLHLGKIDAKLYYLKNLVILKYQLNNFDIHYTRTETSLDFTGGLNELYSLFKKGEIMVNLNKNGIFDMISRTVPKVINNMIDAKLEVELEINNSVNELLTEFLNSIIEPLNKEGDDFQGNFELFKKNMNDSLPNFKNQIILYMNDLNILDFLLRTLGDFIISYHDEYYQKLTEKLTQENKLNEISFIMEPEIFVNFVNNLIDTLLNDDSLKNNLQDIKPLLKFDEELDNMAGNNESSPADPDNSI